MGNHVDLQVPADGSREPATRCRHVALIRNQLAVHHKEFHCGVTVFTEYEGAQNGVLELGTQHCADGLSCSERPERNTPHLCIEDECCIGAHRLRCTIVRLEASQD